MRLCCLIALWPALLAAQDAHEIVCRSLELDQKNLEAARDYSYSQRQLERQFDGSGKIKSESIRTWDVTFEDGSPYRRLVARDDQPLTAAEQQSEKAKLMANVEERRRESAAERQRRIAEWDRRRRKQREPLSEMADAFDFHLVGEQPFNGAEAYVIDATPKPGYRPKSTAAAVLPKMKARLWISKSDSQWIKVEAETLAPVTFGAFLLRIAAGARIVLEQASVNHAAWLPKRIALEGSARLFLIKGLNTQLDISYSEYKKSQADSRPVEGRVLKPPV